MVNLSQGAEIGVRWVHDTAHYMHAEVSVRYRGRILGAARTIILDRDTHEPILTRETLLAIQQAVQEAKAFVLALVDAPDMVVEELDRLVLDGG